MPAIDVASLRARRAVVLATGKRKRLRRLPIPKQRPPSDRSYRARLLAVVGDVERLVESVLLPVVLRLPTTRVDAPGDELDEAVDQIRARLGSGVLSDRSLRSMAERASAEVNRHNRAAIDRQFEATIGAGLPPVEPRIADLQRSFVRDNVRLIRSLGFNTLEQVEGVVLAGFRRGKPNREIAREIAERIGASRSRARLIARDQVAKLNGELTQLRQQSMGVTRYTWRATPDERTRPEHEERDGQIFEWSDPPEDGHPGEPVNCRCTAEPVLEDLLAALE